MGACDTVGSRCAVVPKPRRVGVEFSTLVLGGEFSRPKPRRRRCVAQAEGGRHGSASERTRATGVAGREQNSSVRDVAVPRCAHRRRSGGRVMDALGVSSSVASVVNENGGRHGNEPSAQVRVARTVSWAGAKELDGRAEPFVALAGMVIHRLFGIGLSLELATNLVTDPDTDQLEGAAHARLEFAVEELDGLIRDLRVVAFDAASTARMAVTSSTGADDSVAGTEAMRLASAHIERASSLLAAHQPPPGEGAAWWSVETAQRSLHGASLALAESSRRDGLAR